MGTGKTRTLFNIMKTFQAEKSYRRIFVTTSKLMNAIVSSNPIHHDVRLTWPDMSPDEIFTRHLFRGSSDAKEFHSDRHNIEVLTYEELYQLLTRTRKNMDADDQTAKDN